MKGIYKRLSLNPHVSHPKFVNDGIDGLNKNFEQTVIHLFHEAQVEVYAVSQYRSYKFGRCQNRD